MSEVQMDENEDAYDAAFRVMKCVLEQLAEELQRMMPTFMAAMSLFRSPMTHRQFMARYQRQQMRRRRKMRQRR